MLLAGLAFAGATTALAQAPAQPPAPAPAPEQTTRPGEPFGEEVVLAPKKIVYLKGTATWDTAFDTLVESTGRKHGVAEPLQMTVAVSDGERLYAARYASGPVVNSLFVSEDAKAIRALYPDDEPVIVDAVRGIRPG